MMDWKIPSITEKNAKKILSELLEQCGHHIQSYLSLQWRRCDYDNVAYMANHLPDSPDDWLQKMTYITQAFYKLAQYYKLVSKPNGYADFLKATNNEPDTAVDLLMQEFEKGWDSTEIYYGS